MGAPLLPAGLVTDRHAGADGEEAAATFSPDPGRTYRYALMRRWDPARPVAAFIMLNPSTADAVKHDSTSRRCVGFARSWGAGGILLVNLFALRATDPRELRTHPDPVGPHNDLVLAWLPTAATDFVTPVVAAWGVHGAFRGRGREVASQLEARGVRLSCLGLSQAGHPKHPLYLPGTTTPVDYPHPPRTNRKDTP